MRQLRLTQWVGLAMVGVLGSCGGGGPEPNPSGGAEIRSDSVPQSFPVDAPISVQMTQWQPINLTMTAGNSLTMTVDAIGQGPLVYSWRFKGNLVEGQTGRTYVIPSVQLSNQGNYNVTVANNANIAISQMVNLTVIPKPAPPTNGP